MNNPAEISEFTCTLCLQPFEDKAERLPRLLPDCGHTFCSQCIMNLLENAMPNSPFVCPEDNVEISINKKEITYFPKNFALLKLLEKKKMLSVNTKPACENVQTEKDCLINESMLIPYREEDDNLLSQQQITERNFKRNSFKSFNEKSQEIKENWDEDSNVHHVNEKPNNFAENKEIKDFYSQNENYLQNNAVNPKKMCLEHQRKLEVVCIDHQIRICTKCALFGVHKNHNIKPEEDVIMELSNRAHSLLKLFKEVDQNQKNVESEQFFNAYKAKIQEKQEELCENINQKFEEIINKLRMQQEKLVEELRNKFEDLTDRFKVLSSPQKHLSEKIFAWQAKASKILETLNEKADNEIPFALLPNTTSPQNDIIKSGESIYFDQKRAKESVAALLSETLKSIKINLKSNTSNIFEGICQIDNIFPEEITRKWTENLSKPKKSNQTFFSFISKFEKPHTASLEEKIVNKFEEKSNSGNASSINDAQNKDQSQRHPNFFNEEEHNLLSSEVMSFILTELNGQTNQATHNININNKNSSDNSIVYSNNSHINTSATNQNASGFGNLTPIRSPNDVSLQGNNQKVLTESLITNQNGGRKTLGNHASNEKTQLRGNTPNTDRRLFMNEPNLINNNNSNNANNGSKLYKKKSKFIIAEKYEPVLEGLKKDNLEIVDFTGAELGDSGLQYICEYIKISKNVKSLKLLKNKITNDGVIILLKALSENNSLISLNLSQNSLSDKVLDIFSNFFQNSHSIKLLCLNQNNINVRNAKNKMMDFKKMGITASV